MMLAAEFSRSAIARQTDFSTSVKERGVFRVQERNGPSRLIRGALIAQFAASDPVVFADATELIYPYVDGVDLNCGTICSTFLITQNLTSFLVHLGCPQRWAYQEQVGSFLLRQPET